MLSFVSRYLDTAIHIYYIQKTTEDNIHFTIISGWLIVILVGVIHPSGKLRGKTFF